MKRYALIAAWLASATIAVFAQTSSKPAPAPLLDENRLLAQIEQIAPNGSTNIFGDPSKPGMYVVRTRLAPNAKTRPRYYDRDRWVTVVKGTWWVGQGEVFRTDKLVPLREGGVMYQPANVRTFDIAASSDVVLQIFGTGPLQSTHAEVDAKGQPVPIEGPYPEDLVEEGGRRGRGGRRARPPAPQNQTPQQPQ